MFQRRYSLFQAFYYLNAWNRLQRRKEWICESRCQVSDHLHFFVEYFDLNPYPSTNTVYARSAFYTQSGILPQSAVCVLHWLVFHLCSIYLLLLMFWSIFFCFTPNGGSSYCYNFDKIHYTAPLSRFLLSGSNCTQ